RNRQRVDSVIVAFAGHGLQFRGDEGSYFCPMNAVPKDKSTLVPLADVYGEMEKSRAGFKLMLVDACRNNPLSDNSRSRASVELESVTRPPQTLPGGVAALFSCSPGQKAYEHDDLKHGVFFHFVIQGLRGEADLDKDHKVVLQ